MSKQSINRFLVVNPFGIGDVLFSTPLLRAIKSRHSDSYVAYLCNNRSKDVLVNNPNIDDIFIFEKDELKGLWQKSKLRFFYRINRQIRRMRKCRFDYLIDLSLTHEFAFLSLFLGIKNRVGFNYKNRGRFLTKSITIDGFSDKHIVEYYTNLLNFIGIPQEQKYLELFVSPEDIKEADGFIKQKNIKSDKLILGIIPGGGASWGAKSYYKHWPAEYYCQLIKRAILEMNAQIILFGGSDDVRLCQKIVDDAGSDQVINTCGQLSLTRFAALINKCGVVIANDGGPLHVAASQNVKTLSFFGPVDPNVYGPYPQSENHRVLTFDIPCRPCYQKFRVPDCPYEHRCLTEISPEKALSVLSELIEMKKSKNSLSVISDDARPVSKPMREVASIKEAQEVQRAIYNRSFKDGSFGGVVADLSYKTRINFTLHHAKGNQNRILDLGSGDGTIDRGVAHIAREIIGIDISQRAVSLAEKYRKGEKIKYINMAIEDYNSYEKFDLVMMYEILEHVYDAKGVLEKVFDLLNDDGILLLSTPNYLKLIRRVKLFLPIRKLRTVMGKNADRINFDHYREFCYPELKEMLEEVGFEVFGRKGVVIWSNTVGGDALRNCLWAQKLNFKCGEFFPNVAGDMYLAVRKVKP